MDSGVLFHTTTNSQGHKTRMLIVIHCKISRSFFNRDLLLAAWYKTCVEPKQKYKQKCRKLSLLPKFWGPPKSGALGLNLFSLMVNPRLAYSYENHYSSTSKRIRLELYDKRPEICAF